MQKVLYKKTKLKKIEEWKIWVEEKGESGFPEVHIVHGLTDGKKQTTFDIIKDGVNVGKANETSPLEQANLVAERKIVKQLEEGYRETIQEANEKIEIDFALPFPKELCFYKPKNSIDDKKLQLLEQNKQSAYMVKRDGMMHVIRKTKKFGVEIYSRRMDLVTYKYPHLIKRLEAVKEDDFVLLGEMILINKDGTDNFNGVSQICRSDPEESIKKQEKLGKVSYYAFDIAFKNNINLLTSKNYGDRYLELQKIMSGLGPFFYTAEKIDKSHKEAMEEVKKRKLEGLVVWDTKAIMKEDEAFTFNGKSYRPNLIFKSKPKYEDDFIVKWDAENGIGDYGSGKNKGKIKNVFLYQLDEDGNEIYLGKCGGGLSDAQRDFYTDASKFPRVWRIEYDSIQPKTGALRFPVFNADRIGDKDIGECLMSDKIKEARTEQGDDEVDD